MNKVVTLITLGVLISKSVEAQIVMVKDIATDFPISNVTIESAISSAIKTDTAGKANISAFKQEDEIIRIEAIINVARETQKGIIIGHQGKALKKVGTQARKDLETFFGKKIFIKLFVKVTKNWRDNEKDLKRFGYFI